MADKSFDRTVLHPLEKPLAVDLNQLQSQIDCAMRETPRHLFASRTSDLLSDELPVSGFIGNGFRAQPMGAPAMQVQLLAGLGFQDLLTGTVANGDDALMASVGTIVGLDDLERYKPLLLAAAQSFTVPAAPSSPNTRIDLIEVLADRRLENALSRLVLNPTTGSFEVASLQKTLAWALDGRIGTVSAPADSATGLGYKVGIAANPGTAPATSPGYLPLCYINVGSGVTEITYADIFDQRRALFPRGSGHIAAYLEIPVGGASVPPEHSSVIGPPGFDLVVTMASTPESSGLCNIFVIGRVGVPYVGLIPSVQVADEPAFSGGAPALAVPRILSSAVIQLTAGDIAEITDSDLSSNPALEVAEAQTASKTTVQVVVQAAGTTGSDLATYLGGNVLRLYFRGVMP